SYTYLRPPVYKSRACHGVILVGRAPPLIVPSYRRLLHRIAVAGGGEQSTAPVAVSLASDAAVLPPAMVCRRVGSRILRPPGAAARGYDRPRLRINPLIPRSLFARRAKKAHPCF